MFAEARSATRRLARWRGGAIVAVLTLAVGIGTTVALSALVRVLLAELPGVPDLGRVARIYASSPELHVERGRVTLGEFDAALSHTAAFAAAGGYADEDATVGGGTNAYAVIAGYASPGFFGAMAVPPAAGRVFTPGDLSGPAVVVLGDALWRREFPDGRIAGATLIVDGVQRAVIGVMPPSFHYPFVGVGADLWLPLLQASYTMPAIVDVYARLRSGATWQEADAELDARSRGHAQWTWRAVPIGSDARRRAIDAYAATLGPAVLVLLMACINVACLLLARGVAREKELAVRRALGASRGRIVRLLLGESLVLATAGGVLGTALAAWILRLLASAFRTAQPTLAGGIVVDMRLLPVALASSAAACLLFGMVPAFRLSKRKAAATLKELPTVHRFEIAGYGARDVIVFAETAAAAGFLVWTAMLYTLLAQVSAITPAFPADRLVGVRVPAAIVHEVLSRVAAVPGVESSAVSSGMLGGGLRERIEVPGDPPMLISRVPVGARFFETLELPILAGRAFDATELDRRAPVAVLNQSAARALGAHGAVGQRLRTSNGTMVTVIGVCRDPVDYGALSRVDTFAPREMYVPFEISVSADTVVLARTIGDPRPAVRAIAAAAQTPAGTRPARPVILREDFRDRGAAGMLLAVTLLAWFAVLALLLAASGIFAVINQSVAQRTREFGVRLALGATRPEVLWMVLAREGRLIGAAVGTGVVFTMLATRALFVDLTRVNVALPSMWIGAVLLSGGVAACAATFAAWRILRLDPAVVLRRT